MIDEEKQIEEMARVMHERSREIAEDTEGIAKLEAQGKTFPDDFAEVLYNAGYRKVEWISVEDRLPIKDEYLTHHNDGLDTLKQIIVAYMTDTIEYAIGCFDGYKWVNQLGNRVIKDVIAWKPFELYTSKMKGE